MFIFGLSFKQDIIYDIETYPNFFSFAAESAHTEQRWYFELSDWRNDREQLLNFLGEMVSNKCRMVGYNNVGFDYPVLHFALKIRIFTADFLYKKAQDVLFGDRFANTIWDNDQIIPQIDLYKIHHFDNFSKATSLKIIEFNVRAQNLQELPFPPGTVLTEEQAELMRQYNFNDVVETKRFYHKTQTEIKLREALGEKFKQNFMNCSDVKIGEKILVIEMQKRGLYSYTSVGGRRVKKQTYRDQIIIKDLIFPYIKLEQPEFKRIYDYLNEKIITETKGVFNDLTATVGHVEYKIGTGGLHGSIDNSIVESTGTMQLVDIDVASFYPNLGIVNRIYPAHLGVAFCDAYESIFHTRKTYSKNSPENGAYKLALNGAYGGSNNEYSPFYDPAYTMSITINGQLLLLMLIEQLIKTPSLQMIQANTDGVTCLCPREYLEHMRSVCRWWEGLTGLQLEEALYSRMFIRDVNNYIAEKTDGKLKRIGAYAYETALENPGTRELPWHKDWSARVVQMAAEAYLVHGTSIEEFIAEHEDYYDFLLRTKVPKTSELHLNGEMVGHTIRYFIANEGGKLEKVMPSAGTPGEYKRANKLTDEYFNSIMREIGSGVWDGRIHTKNKSKYDERCAGIHPGYKICLCNDLNDYNFNNLNIKWYIKEATKLVNLRSYNGQ